MNILCASDRVIIPVEASPWGMFGLANMFEFLNEVKQITPELEVAGIAVTKVDTRKSYYKQTMETLHELEDIHVFEQIIRVDSSVEWSQDNSIPVSLPLLWIQRASLRFSRHLHLLHAEYSPCLLT